MLKLADLASRPDFKVGALQISPSRRLVAGPSGEVHVEPIVMKVFLLLLEGSGRVVTRDELFANAWGDVFVGDESLNRAIHGVRKIEAEAARGYFEIQTIPRTGYTLTGKILADLDEQDPANERGPLTRRMAIGAGAATLAAGGAGLWFAHRARTDAHFKALMSRGGEALRLDQPASEYFRRAVELEPRNALARGLLAYALANPGIPSSRAVPAPALQAADRAAQAAFDLDPKEPNALLAMTFVESGTLGWLQREKRLRYVLELDPTNTLAMRALGLMLHGVGRCRESLAIAERALAIDPLSPGQHFRKVLELWSTGRLVEADQDLNRAMELWPAHPLVRLARLMVYAFTSRARAALALIDDEEKVPIFSSRAAATAWRTFLVAQETRTASAIEAARRANIEGAKDDPPTAASAILMLTSLGDLDAAFDVAYGFFLGRGSVIIPPSREAATAATNGSGWRNTNGLFQPPTKPMRRDTRFRLLADELGLTEYWRMGGIGPDAFLFDS